MNKLKQILTILRKYWLISLLVVSAVVIFISAIIQAITPKIPTAPVPEIVETGVNGINTSFNGLTYSGNQPSVPETLSVYTVLPGGISEEQIEQQFARTYGLEQSSTDGKNWLNNDYNLSATGEGEYYFIKNETQSSSVLSQTTAISAAQTFLQDLFPELALIPIESDIVYLGGTYELEEVSRNKATQIAVPFSYAIDSYPVYFGQSTYAPFLITVDSSAQVSKAFFQSLFSTFTSPIPYQTIAVQEAVTNIQNNKGSLVQANRGGEHGELSLNSVVKGTLTSASISYRVDTQQQYAYPYYNFEGEFYNSEGVRFFGTVVTPAIKTE